jgi:septum formation protein
MSNTNGVLPFSLLTANVPIILASTSPRRRELMSALVTPFGLTYRLEAPPVDEASIDVTGLTPPEVVQRLASAKAQSVAHAYPDHLVIGADTLVVLNKHTILGKPTTTAEAVAMLQQLQGKTHQVYTGLAVCYGMNTHQAVECTTVRMRALSPEACQAYVATGEPMDKAGAYAIQGVGSMLIEAVEGCYFNVVGLPMYRLSQLLEQTLAA